MKGEVITWMRIFIVEISNGKYEYLCYHPLICKIYLQKITTKTFRMDIKYANLDFYTSINFFLQVETFVIGHHHHLRCLQIL